MKHLSSSPSLPKFLLKESGSSKLTVSEEKSCTSVLNVFECKTSNIKSYFDFSHSLYLQNLIFAFNKLLVNRKKLARLSQLCWWARRLSAISTRCSIGSRPDSWVLVPLSSFCLKIKVKWPFRDEKSVALHSLDPSKDAVTTTFSGLICLMGYMSFDSFTSNWQSEVFKYKMSSMEMMFGVNVFSCLFTSWSLIQQGLCFWFSEICFHKNLKLYFIYFSRIPPVIRSLYYFSSRFHVARNCLSAASCSGQVRLKTWTWN